jgi:hypothetical protein
MSDFLSSRQTAANTEMWIRGRSSARLPLMHDRERERRLDARVADDVVRAEYVVPTLRVRDLSASGLYLLDPNPLQDGQIIELRLYLGSSEPLEVRGMVRRADSGLGMAIEFTRISAADRHRIKQYIAAVDPKTARESDDLF